MTNIITNYICETNFIIGIFIGIIFVIVAMILIGLWMDRDTTNRIKKDLGEDFELIAIPKSKIKKVGVILEKVNNDSSDKED